MFVEQATIAPRLADVTLVVNARSRELELGRHLCLESDRLVASWRELRGKRGTETVDVALAVGGVIGLVTIIRSPWSSVPACARHAAIGWLARVLDGAELRIDASSSDPTRTPGFALAKTLGSYYPLATVRALRGDEGSRTSAHDVSRIAAHWCSPAAMAAGRFPAWSLRGMRSASALELVRTSGAEYLNIRTGHPELARALADVLHSGTEVGPATARELFRDSLAGDDLSVYRAILGSHDHTAITGVANALASLERTLVRVPPFGNPELQGLLLLSTMFGWEDGLVSPGPSVSRIADLLELSSETRALAPALTDAIRLVLEGQRGELLSRSIAELAASAVRGRGLRGIEIPELGMALLVYLETWYGGTIGPFEELAPLVIRHALPEWWDHELDHTPGLVNTRDLAELGTERARSDVGEESLTQLALGGVLKTRSSALGYCGAELASPAHRSLLDRSGSSIAQFHPLGEVGRIQRHRATVRFFEIRGASRLQFRPTEMDGVILGELIASGNYPELRREFLRAGYEDREAIKMLRDGRSRSLPELTSMCRELEWKRRNIDGFDLGIENVPSVESAQLSYARIERRAGELAGIDEIDLAVGYQGRREKTGSGLRHIVEEREKDRKRLAKLLCSAADDAGLVQRFVLDGVIEVASASTAIIPSGQRPRTHSLLIGPPKDIDGIFVVVVVARLPEYEGAERRRSIVTAFAEGSAEKLRAYLVKQLALGFKTHRDRDLVDQAIQSIEPMLEEGCTSPIRGDEVLACMRRSSEEVGISAGRPALVISRGATIGYEASVTRWGGGGRQEPPRSENASDWRRIGSALSWSPIFAAEQLGQSW